MSENLRSWREKIIIIEVYFKLSALGTKYE
jgi:hypothetical protein